jgi:hypothetical protein
MKCPHCDKEIQGITCPRCGETIPRESKYCLYCGIMLKDDSLRDDGLAAAEETDDFDFENRIPCSDGTCIGIIINGRCNICGKRFRAKKK